MIEFSISLFPSLPLYFVFFFFSGNVSKMSIFLGDFWIYLHGIDGLKWILNCEAIYQSFVILIEWLMDENPRWFK